MKLLLPLLPLALALLAACNGPETPRPLFVDRNDTRDLPTEAQERAAREELRDIERRVRLSTFEKVWLVIQAGGRKLVGAY